MRAVRLLVVLLIFVLGALGGSGAARQAPTSRERPTRSVTSAELFGAHAGLVTTETCSKHRCRHRLYLTRDLGKTWRDITPRQVKAEMPFYDVFWRGRRRGWAVAGFCDQGRLVRTTDAGRTWHATRSFSSLGCHGGAGDAIDFVDARHGFLDEWDPVGEGSQIRRTTTGGRRWSDGNEVRSVGPVNFRDRRHGYLASVQFGHQLRYSASGGRRWALRSVPRPVGYRHADRIYDLPTFAGNARILPVTLVRRHREDVAFYSASIGPGGWGDPVLLRSHLKARHDYSFSLPVPTSVASPTRWWAFYGRGTHLAVTHDGGQTWSLRDPPLRGAAGSISAAGGRSAWVTTSDGDRGRAYATRSGGRHWRRMRPWR